MTVNTAGKTAGMFTYEKLSSPVTLSANTSYYLMSQETLNGDEWHDWDCVVSTSGAATVQGTVYNERRGQSLR